MADLNRLLSDNLALVIGALAVIVLVLTGLVIAQSIRLGRATRAYGELIRGTDGASGASLRSPYPMFSPTERWGKR